MIKCLNCELPAEYVYESQASNTQYFCVGCIPWTLQERFKAGVLPTIEGSSLFVEEPAKTTSKSKSSKAVAPDPVVVDTPAEEVVAEAPAETPAEEPVILETPAE